MFINNAHRIIVVGNGHSLRRNIHGPAIDQYDVVIRVGDFRTKGFEQWAGSKTTVWFTRDKINSPVPLSAILEIWDGDILKGVDNVNVTRYPATGAYYHKLLPEQSQASDLFRVAIFCITTWQSNLISVLGHGPGCYWTDDQGEQTKLWQAETNALSHLQKCGLVWNRSIDS